MRYRKHTEHMQLTTSLITTQYSSDISHRMASLSGPCWQAGNRVLTVQASLKHHFQRQLPGHQSPSEEMLMTSASSSAISLKGLHMTHISWQAAGHQAVIWGLLCWGELYVTALPAQQCQFRVHLWEGVGNKVKPLLHSSQQVALSKPCGLDIYLPQSFAATSVSMPMALTADTARTRGV